ncbi:hypothetical protein HY78_21675 [Rhizorhabdus wittichii DC-6]|jgi:hypothetical protein|uniref:SnoaL-like domain-containing protein n=2 Tax=Rhizorhabdus wittichii TaxID=160791 RepID=A0A9J9H992_RHIWR|nr:nuclear transport factor 2 family protein [Rhizorhabdus wittichii]ABQ67335.1 hypothetical protein Swit_0968 [Rhizorhabdus wittichii RW1]ARR55872.1 hypothetical protein HY78_21675 [Rhizorhabdus wittichii DC-6]QTH23332.1 nuclear transport factor 2 family protein [Rhizorhabdus wittichii]
MSAGPSIEQRLARIEARAEITDLVARYARGADRKNDPAILGPLFAEDALWSAEGFAALTGRAAIATGLAALAADRVLWSIHYMTAPLVELSDDGATARCHWYLWELCTLSEAAGPTDSWFGGWYDSELRRTGEGWRFTRVTLDVRIQGEANPPWQLKKPVQM